MKNELKGMGCFCLNRKLNLEQLRFKIFIPKMECLYLLLLGDSTVSGARGRSILNEGNTGCMNNMMRISLDASIR